VTSSVPCKSAPRDLLTNAVSWGGPGNRRQRGSLSFLLPWPRAIAGHACVPGWVFALRPPPGAAPGSCAISPGDAGLVIPNVAQTKSPGARPAHPASPPTCNASLSPFLTQPCCQLQSPALKRNNKTLGSSFAVPATQGGKDLA